MNRLVTFLAATCTLVYLGCDDSRLTGPDLDASNAAELAKGKPGGGGKPGGDFTNWAFAALEAGNIVISSSDGNTRKTIVRCGGDRCRSPHFTEDGSSVLYLRSDPRNFLEAELRMVGVDGKNDRMVFDFSTFYPQPWYGQFDLMPGSSKIIYNGYSDIAVVDYETGDPQRIGWSSIVPGGWCNACLGEVSAGHDLDPAARFQGPIVLGWADGQGSDIYVVEATEDVDGTVTLDPSTIVRLRLPDSDTEGGQGLPEFSADGTRIAFLDRAFCCSGEELKVVDFDISAWQFSPTGPHLIASTEFTPLLSRINGQPAWSPDGLWVVYSGNFEGGSELVIIDPDYNLHDPDYCPDPIHLPYRAGYYHPDWNPAWVNDIDTGGC